MIIANQIFNFKDDSKKAIINVIDVNLSFPQKLILLFTGKKTKLTVIQLMPIDNEDNIVEPECRGIISSNKSNANTIVNEYLSSLSSSKEQSSSSSEDSK